MADLTVVGFGPGPWKKLTVEVRDLLMQAERVYVRDPFWEVCRRLEEEGKKLVSFHHLYLSGLDLGVMYDLIADCLFRSCRLYGPQLYALPGNPFVFEWTAGMLVDRATREGIRVRVVEGMSCLETIFCQHGLDPAMGLQILNFPTFAFECRLDPELPALIFQIGAPLQGDFARSGRGYEANVRLLERRLAERFKPGHPVYVLKPSDGDDDCQIRVGGRVGALNKLESEITLYSTLFVPPLGWLR